LSIDHISGALHPGAAAERNDISEPLAAEEVGFVKRTDTGLAEPTINIQRPSADTEAFTEASGDTAASDQTVGGQCSELTFLEPCQD
jgi:hypothetical protein